MSAPSTTPSSALRAPHRATAAHRGTTANRGTTAHRGTTPAPAATTRGAGAAAAGGEPVRGRHRAPGRSRWSASRRRSLFLAATMAGVAGIGVLPTSGPAAQADAGPVSRSTSIAAELGLRSGSPAPSPDQAVARLEELTASRAQRETLLAAAAQAQQQADAQAAADAAAEAARPHAVLPVDGAPISSGFGARWGTVHAGVDFAAPMDTPERAVLDGVVLRAGPASGFGLAVYVQHADGDVTVYGHMDKILVQTGQTVRAGDVLALLGDRGESTGPHLHFEVHRGGLDGERVDPLPWLRAHGLPV